jgi:protein-S-isoprenylcysteine O-methyltransferase Ste14
MNQQTGGSLIPSSIKIDKVYNNLSQEVIITTTEKLKNVLLEHLKYLERRKDWIAPASLTMTLITVFATTDFKKQFFSADSWCGFFMFCLFCVIIWLIITIIHAVNAKSTDDIIEAIKKDSEKLQSEQNQT